MEIRLLNKNDIVNNDKKVKELIGENLKLSLTNIGELSKLAKETYENLLEFIDDNSAILVGTIKENEIIGFIWAYKRDFHGEARIHISHIIVDSKIRSAGIGKKMLDLLEDIALENKIKKLELIATAANERTLKFYEKNNFQIARLQFEKELGDLNEN